MGSLASVSMVKGHDWPLTIDGQWFNVLMANDYNWSLAIELLVQNGDFQLPKMVNIQCFDGQWPKLLKAKDPQLCHNSYLDSSNPVPLRTYL